MSPHVTLRQVTSLYVTSYYVMLCHIMSRHAMSCHVISYHVTLCLAVMQSVMSFQLWHRVIRIIRSNAIRGFLIERFSAECRK